MFTIVAAQTRWHDRCQQQRREQTDKKRREDKTRRENKSDNMIHVCIHLRRRAAASGAGRPYILLFGRPQLGWIRRRRRTTASVDLCVCIFPLGRSLSRSSRIMLSINKEEGWALIQFERPTASAAAAAAAAAPFLLWLFTSHFQEEEEEEDCKEPLDTQSHQGQGLLLLLLFLLFCVCDDAILYPKSQAKGKGRRWA